MIKAPFFLASVGASKGFENPDTGCNSEDYGYSSNIFLNSFFNQKNDKVAFSFNLVSVLIFVF